MKTVLVGCERSGVVRDAFRARGFDAYSCDLEEAPKKSKYHIVGDVFDTYYLYKPDLFIVHPPCTYLTVSGNRHYAGSKQRQEALQFIHELFELQPKHFALENPVGVISTQIKRPDQYVQPWMFGEDASKKTGLWLRNLPLLKPTNVIKKKRYSNQTPSGQNNLAPSEDRAYLRSITYQGIADAMAVQWGDYILNG